MTTTDWIRVAGVLVTSCAVLVAIFQDKIRSWVTRPKLNVSIKLGPPDCHSIPLVRTDLKTGETLLEAPCYYLRLRVDNSGNQKAESVEVFAAELLKCQADGQFKEVESFLPMNLRWAHYREIIFPAIVPGVYKHCDLGHIIDPQLRSGFPPEDKSWENVPPEKTVLSLDTAVKPNTRSYLIPPGKYHLVLLVAAANAKPIKKTLEITLTGDWYEDEKRMLGEGIGIREV